MIKRTRPPGTASVTSATIQCGRNMRVRFAGGSSSVMTRLTIAGYTHMTEVHIGPVHSIVTIPTAITACDMRRSLTLNADVIMTSYTTHSRIGMIKGRVCP